MSTYYVIKSTGEREPFSFRKVLKSALRVGASKDLALEIAEAIKKGLHPGITTAEISEKVQVLLEKKARRSSLLFNLKKSIKELGPTGFPFEKYVGEIFENLNFEVKINQLISGLCAKNYEIDFLAKKADLVYIGECKYRNIFSERVDLKDALANFARFSDILDGPYCKQAKYKNCKIKTILVTNGKFTKKAINYSLCKGVDLLGWRYPKDESLEYLVESRKLYPITILPSLKDYLKGVFAENHLMLARDVLHLNASRFAEKERLQERDVLALIKEAELLLVD